MFKYNIIKINDVDSTNNHALALKASDVFNEGLVVVSDFQTKGKGQRGESWFSERGRNLLASVVVEPNILIGKQFDISKIASLAIIDCLLLLGLKSKIKWPNDILVRRKKVAGILIQNVISKGVITHSVIGVGLNINQSSFDDYEPRATSLKLELGNDYAIEEIQEMLLISIQNRIKTYRSGLDMEAEFNTVLFQKDKISSFEDAQHKFNGIIRGVNNRGLLVVEAEGKIREFDIKEVKMLF